jgi:NAD(P)-dependent dehydrogenase (short-subunit alcohol dehydrogenase family)
MATYWSDKTAVVTGGSRGLGLELARELKAQGARVSIWARDPDELRTAQAELGDEILALRCDVASPVAVRKAMERVEEAFGNIDLIVNNAGVIQTGPVEALDAADFRRSLDMHLWGPLYTSAAVIPHMRGHGGGHIVNISSIGGKVAVPHLLPYSVGKFALAGFSLGLYAEAARDGVWVTTVFPGLMRTGSPVPGVSVNVARAAKQILRAAARRRPHVVVGLPARLAALAEGVMPNTTQRALRFVNQFLPRPGGAGAHEASGRDSESPATRRTVTRASRGAERRN